jgi:hypothetical protein
MWAPKMSTKGRTGDQRTKDKDGQISNLSSLSLSLFCVAYASIHSSSSRKKRSYRITRPKKAQRILPPSRFSQYLRSRDGVVVSSERESTKKASEHPPREEKQTNKQTKNLKKCQRGIFQRAKSGRF